MKQHRALVLAMLAILSLISLNAANSLFERKQEEETRGRLLDQIHILKLRKILKNPRACRSLLRKSQNVPLFYSGRETSLPKKNGFTRINPHFQNVRLAPSLGKAQRTASQVIYRTHILIRMSSPEEHAIAAAIFVNKKGLVTNCFATLQY